MADAEPEFVLIRWAMVGCYRPIRISDGCATAIFRSLNEALGLMLGSSTTQSPKLEAARRENEGGQIPGAHCKARMAKRIGGSFERDTSDILKELKDYCRDKVKQFAKDFRP